MRIRCWFFGCEVGSEPFEGHCCHRCNADLYENFLQAGGGLVEFIRTMVHRWKHSRFMRHHQCEVCGKDLWWTEDYCCSDECRDKWIPF
jgi:hypothetical protein